MKALVLGGGSIKGGWQIGAIKAVFEHGYIPNIISGISVGTMNGTWIANRVGELNTENIDWAKEVGDHLIDFWIKNITNPNSIAIKRKTIPLLWNILRGKFKGASDTTPLRNIIYDTITVDNIINSEIDLYVGTVNVSDGKLIYARPYFSNFLEYVLASSAIPFMMPVSHIGNQPYLDGGLRDSAPLKIAIDAGATEIICIACHPEEMSAVEVNTGKVMELADRLMDIVSNNNLNNDINQARLINQLLEDGNSSRYLDTKKKIKLTIIRPEVQVTTQITDFNTDDIKRMIQSGYETADSILSE